MNIKSILKQQLELVKPDKETFDKIKGASKGFIKYLEGKLRKIKIKADVFIGGSLAKKTLVKKGIYDVDIFVRFDNTYEDKEISKLLGKILGKSAKKIHGSRDYYQVRVEGIIIEVIPVIKIKKPVNAQNTTDLSYFHVKYILKKIKKNKKLSNEILLAKSFVHAQNCYGAESYIQGFSGYALELLVCYYGSFLKFISAVVKENKDKLIIDMEKLYKNKNEILILLNKAKLYGPIILIDPTFRQRNALAGLSNETLIKFKQICKKFLKNPNSEFFEKKSVGGELRRKYKNKLKVVSVKTTKQVGDIAGSKSKKFFRFFIGSLKKDFEVKISEFNYYEKKNLAEFYFVVGKKKDEIIRGPEITDVHNLKAFKKAHPKAFIKNHFSYVKIFHDMSFEKWFELFKKNKKKIIKEMDVKEIN